MSIPTLLLFFEKPVRENRLFTFSGIDTLPLPGICLGRAGFLREKRQTKKRRMCRFLPARIYAAAGIYRDLNIFRLFFRSMHIRTMYTAHMIYVEGRRVVSTTR